MIRRQPRVNGITTLVPYTTLFRSDRWRSEREDREGGNVPTGAIAGPPSAILALGQTPGVGTAYGALRTSQDGPIFRREIRLNAAPPDRMGEHPSTVEYPPPD